MVDVADAVYKLSFNLPARKQLFGETSDFVRIRLKDDSVWFKPVESKDGVRDALALKDRPRGGKESGKDVLIGAGSKSDDLLKLLRKLGSTTDMPFFLLEQVKTTSSSEKGWSRTTTHFKGPGNAPPKTAPHLRCLLPRQGPKRPIQIVVNDVLALELGSFAKSMRTAAAIIQQAKLDRKIGRPNKIIREAQHVLSLFDRLHAEVLPREPTLDTKALSGAITMLQGVLKDQVGVQKQPDLFPVPAPAMPLVHVEHAHGRLTNGRTADFDMPTARVALVDRFAIDHTTGLDMPAARAAPVDGFDNALAGAMSVSRAKGNAIQVKAGKPAKPKKPKVAKKPATVKSKPASKPAKPVKPKGKAPSTSLPVQAVLTLDDQGLPVRGRGRPSNAAKAAFEAIQVQRQKDAAAIAKAERASVRVAKAADKAALAAKAAKVAKTKASKTAKTAKPMKPKAKKVAKKPASRNPAGRPEQHTRPRPDPAQIDLIDVLAAIKKPPISMAPIVAKVEPIVETKVPVVIIDGVAVPIKRIKAGVSGKRLASRQAARVKAVVEPAAPEVTLGVETPLGGRDEPEIERVDVDAFIETETAVAASTLVPSAANSQTTELDRVDDEAGEVEIREDELGSEDYVSIDIRRPTLASFSQRDAREGWRTHRRGRPPNAANWQRRSA